MKQERVNCTFHYNNLLTKTDLYQNLKNCTQIIFIDNMYNGMAIDVKLKKAIKKLKKFKA